MEERNQYPLPYKAKIEKSCEEFKDHERQLMRKRIDQINCTISNVRPSPIHNIHQFCNNAFYFDDKNKYRNARQYGTNIYLTKLNLI